MTRYWTIACMLSLLSACGNDHFDNWDQSVELCRDVVQPWASGDHGPTDEAQLLADCECAVSNISGQMSDADFADWADRFKGAAEQIGNAEELTDDHQKIIDDWSGSFARCLM
jgi:hypothetical protein